MFLSALLLGGLVFAQSTDAVVFRSDVSLVRVDAQVLDRDNRAIQGLGIHDFVLREEGRTQEIRNFGSEEMPVDVLLLFDVSASMRPHVQRIASAAHDAMRVLAPGDRVAIMVFDRSSRTRLPFRSDRAAVERELDNMLRDETFRGGTDITRALLDAAAYVGREGRSDARRAVVILTDDMTELEHDPARVERAFVKADAVLSALIAPDAMANRSSGGGRNPGSNGGGYPGSGRGRGGITLGGPLGGIWGPGRQGGNRGGYPGGGNGGGNGGGGPHTKSAGTSEIARNSGGDSLTVDDASALETTLSRLRHRYALHFLVPAGAHAGQERNIEVALADSARRRYPDSEVRFRRTYVAPSGGGSGSEVAAEAPVRRDSGTSDPELITPSSGPRRRRAVSEPDGPRGSQPVITSTEDSPPPSAKVPATVPKADDPNAPIPSKWRKLKPGEQP